MKRSVKNLISVVFIGMFLGFLCLSAVVTLLRNHGVYSYFENRSLAALPELTWEGVLDGSYFSDINSYIQDHTAGRNTVLWADTYINMELLRRPVVNKIVVLDDLLLPWKDYQVTDAAQIETSAEVIADRLKAHMQQVKEYGGYFYYVAVPCQAVCFEDSYPYYLNNAAEFTEVSSASLFANLESRGVPYIDMRPRLAALGDTVKYSSAVDNHFSIYGAYETYHAIMETINADTGWALDVLEDGDYTIRMLPNPYLGSRQRKLFGMRGTDERLGVLTPNLDVPFCRRDYWTEEPVENSSLYSLPRTDEEYVLYNLYMGGDIPNTVVETDRSELPSILIYGDSFTNAVECIIWYNFDTMYSLDLRYYEAMTLEDYIALYKPEVVICIRDYESLLSGLGNGQ